MLSDWLTSDKCTFLSHCFNSTKVQTSEVQIPQSPKTGDGCSTHLAIPFCQVPLVNPPPLTITGDPTADLNGNPSGDPSDDCTDVSPMAHRKAKTFLSCFQFGDAAAFG